MLTFLLNGKSSYSYKDLLQAVRTDDYYPFLKSNDLFGYFSNLIKSLANNVSIVLLDSDLNPAEIGGVDERKINVQKQLCVKKFTSINEVVDAVLKSSSKITIFTSGTTGQPKKVIHSVQTLTRSVRQGDKYKEKIWGFAYNPTHMAGLQVFFQAFINLNALINIFNCSRSQVYSAIENNEITHLSATPTFYRLLLPYENQYFSLERVTLGGEKSDQHLYNAIHKIFPNAKINNVYASTEAGSLFAAKGDCFQIPETIREKIKIVDDELLIHRTLLGQSDSFKFDENYYHSGDLIEWVNESNGIFRFKSRKNELINVGGYKINPEEVENAINQISGVRQSLVYGKENSVLGNVLCAEIQLEEGIKFSGIEIRKALKEKLQDFKIPRKIAFVESITLTRTGKLKRK